MRCPKCEYLGFEGQGRCRNCGYDLSLSNTLPTIDPQASQTFAGAEDAPRDESAPPDLPLRSEPTARERARAAIRQRAAAVRTPPPEAFDLPLFSGSTEPRTLPAPSPTPRPPLSVRRATIEPPRARGGVAPAPASTDSLSDLDVSVVPAETPLTIDPPLSVEVTPPAAAAPVSSRLSPRLALDLEIETGARAKSEDADVRSTAVVPEETDATTRLASIGARVAGGLVDIAVLGLIDAVVLAFTLRLTGLAWDQVGRLPPAPLIAFLALLATGYLSMFTLLAGQTAGQMMAGIRVVEIGGRPVRFGHAVLRAVVQVITVPLLGLGFLPALLGADRRALYDRLSETEVVRADA